MNIEELQLELEKKIAKLDQERKENAAVYAKEREEMLLTVEMERKQRLAEYQAKVAVHEEKEKQAKLKAEADKQAETAKRMAAEQKQLALDEVLRVQREKLEWLETAISNAEFSEEQHKKTLETQRVITSAGNEAYETINVEHPEAPVNLTEPGGAVVGTDGDTPENPLMSQHLKSILRQATRQY